MGSKKPQQAGSKDQQQSEPSSKDGKKPSTKPSKSHPKSESKADATQPHKHTEKYKSTRKDAGDAPTSGSVVNGSAAPASNAPESSTSNATPSSNDVAAASSGSSSAAESTSQQAQPEESANGSSQQDEKSTNGQASSHVSPSPMVVKKGSFVNQYSQPNPHHKANGNGYQHHHNNKSFNNANGQSRPYNKHGNANGQYQQRQYRSNDVNGMGQSGRRYSQNGKLNFNNNNNGNNKQYYGSNQYNNGNGGRHNSHGGHHNNRRISNSFQSYIMPSYYPAGPYVPYGAPAYNNYITQPIVPTDKKAREALLTTLANQIDYYFSAENLLKDIYLRKNMNDHGFLPLNVIASFHRVVGLTYGQLDLILECLPQCKNLEYGTIEEFDETKFRTLESKDDSLLPFQTYKFRAAEDPLKWVLPEDQRLKHEVEW
ncbi:unnamed protein product [Ambrosiozyma monospora]|uniref:Unnamed protein product n=1 Tax=Ambrosiozyma monospora TaxID=43982 RepID=A0A9W6Z6K1_AMBMO|nr:unnamed protein product [Ambrosiozyma monospora]